MGLVTALLIFFCVTTLLWAGYVVVAVLGGIVHPYACVAWVVWLVVLIVVGLIVNYYGLAESWEWLMEHAMLDMTVAIVQVSSGGARL